MDRFLTRPRRPSLVLLVVTYSRGARERLRNACRTHDEVVVRRFGRAALLEETEFGAFLACWLRAVHGGDVQVERTEPLNEFEAVPDSVRNAADAYADRDTPSTPYRTFAAGTEHPDPERLKSRDL
jgi:hypothetical protein